MKKLLESLDECGTMEGGMPPMAPPQPMPRDEGDPVSMNVSLNARGKDHVADLIDMMKNAGLKDAGEVSRDMMPMRRDMERLRDIVDAPMDDPKIPGKDDMPGDRDVTDMGCNDDIEMDDEAVAEYDNEPDETYKALDDVIDSGDDLHKSKKAYKATQDGDNPMALEASIREELYKAIQEKMAEGRGRGKKKDKKTTEGRGKVMAGRGRGKKK